MEVKDGVLGVPRDDRVQIVVRPGAPVLRKELLRIRARSVLLGLAALFDHFDSSRLEITRHNRKEATTAPSAVHLPHGIYPRDMAGSRSPRDSGRTAACVSGSSYGERNSRGRRG